MLAQHSSPAPVFLTVFGPDVIAGRFPRTFVECNAVGFPGNAHTRLLTRRPILDVSGAPMFRQPGRGRLYDRTQSYHLGKIRQVVVPWASKRPPLSVIRPSAVPIRRPELNTTPFAVIRPVSGVIGRTSEILNSRVVWPIPFSSVDKTASP